MPSAKIFAPLMFIVMALLFMVKSTDAAAIEPGSFLILDSVACANCPVWPDCGHCPFGTYCKQNNCACTAFCVKGIPPK
ncbi:hypothetical protein BGZ83_004171 [Gryganskiella cystojenkinii]|nr:hypothetical protein BGZ83_004171 [Gryganskiella cystojenkinii]